MCGSFWRRFLLRIGTNVNIKLVTALAVSSWLMLSFTLHHPAFAQPSSPTTDQPAESPQGEESPNKEESAPAKNESDEAKEEGVQAKEEGVQAKEEEKPIKIPLTEVIGTSPEALEHIPGSGRVITKETIEQNRRFSINETLREVPGVNVRDEEGLGIRPNIGIRGLDPTRSRKVHIMEDGVPIMLMPYGDPSAYYFPPIFRFDRVEVLKGSGQLLFGPQNIGGVINMITRMPPPTPEGNIQFWGGNLNYINTHFDYGGTWGKSGYMVDYTHFQSDVPRFTNTRAKIDDLTFKTVQELSDRTQILAKFNYYREDSSIGYQGLTESMYAQNPRTTPFTNDQLEFTRIGAHVAVNHMFTANLTSTTNFFGHYIDRPWTRQYQQGVDANGNPLGPPVLSNNIPATSYAVTPANGRFTNAREYWVWGIEPRFHYVHRLFGISAEADFGARYMHEQSDRIQFRNVASGAGASFSCFTPPPGATTCLGESNLRTTNAYALFFQERLIMGKFSITPGFRVEHFRYDANNRLANNGNGNQGEVQYTQVLPGIGATYSLNKNHMIFAGAHRGMSPPAVSDAVTATGQVSDLDLELSWTYEIGARGTPTHWAGYELTLFELDFQNQIVTQSVAGGVGATLTNGGRTRHRGLEIATKMDLLDAVIGPNNNQDVTFDVNYTWVADAEFTGSRNSTISGDALLPGEATTVSVTGNRLPYAPRNLLTAGLGYTHRPVGFSARLETQCISDMFADDRNTVTPTPNGQRGLISGWCVLNAAINQYVKPIKTTLFFVGKNMLGQEFIVDRTRGIYAGLPALWQAGAKWTF